MNRPGHAAILTVTIATASTLLLGALTARAAPPTTIAARRTATPVPTPGCVITPTHRAVPERLRPGDATTATVHLDFGCRQPVYPLHVVLVLDGRQLVGDDERAGMEAAARDLVPTILDPGRHNRVGVVGFGDSTTMRCILTSNAERLRSCVRRSGRVRDNRPTQDIRQRSSLEQAVQVATQILIPARVGYEPGTTREVIIVFSAGPHPGERERGADRACQAFLDTAAQAKLQKMLVITVCLGEDCDAACMRRAASSPRYYFDRPDTDRLQSVFTVIRTAIIPLVVMRIHLDYEPAPGVALVPGSAQPEPVGIDPGTNRVSWDWYNVPAAGVTTTLQFRTTATGRQPVSQAVGGRFIDNTRQEGAYVVPPAEVEVTDGS